MKINLFEEYIEEIIKSMDNLEMDKCLLKLNYILENTNTKDMLSRGSQINEAYLYLDEKLSFISKYINRFDIDGINSQDIKYGSKSLITSKYFISKGIKNGNIKDLLKGLLIFSYFKIPFNRVMKIEIFNKKNVELISLELEKIITKLSINIDIPNNAPYNEKKHYEEYKEATKEKDMKKIYGFIDSVRRGVGYKTRGLLRELIKFMAYINPELLKKAIHKKVDPLEIIIIIEALEDKEKLTIGLEKYSENQWVFTGVIYEVLDNNKEEILEEEILNGMKIVLDKLKDINEEIFFETTSFFTNYKSFNIVLGKVLGESDKETISKYVDNYVISERLYQIESDGYFIRNFIEKSEKKKLLFLCSQMFEKWKEYLNGQINEEKYANDLFYTNCFNIIACYYIHRKIEEDKFLLELEKNILEIQEINCRWCQSSIEIRTRLFIKLTYLYLLGIEYKNKPYTLKLSQKILLGLEEIFNDDRIWIYYFGSLKKPSVIKMIEKEFQ